MKEAANNEEINPTNPLARVKHMYSMWGRFSFLYSAQDYITFLARPGFIRNTAVKKLGLRRGDRVLEIACGTGRNFRYVLEAIGPEGRLVGFDYTQEMLDAAARLCKRRGWNNVEFLQGDAARLDIPEPNFDGVLCVLGMSVIPEWEKALMQCKRVLRPGGVLSVCDQRLYRRLLRFLNPMVEAIYSRLAVWNSSRDIPKKMEEIFGNVQVQDFNLGSFFVATSVKRADP